jgi:hypothetical protein
MQLDFMTVGVHLFFSTLDKYKQALWCWLNSNLS